jgi:enoyl-CoA hydratase
MRVETGTDLLLAEIDGGVATMTFNDPDRHNVLSKQMLMAAAPLVAAWDSDATVRVVVLRGAGGRAFAAGADIGEFASGREASDSDTPRSGRVPASAWTCWEALGKPLIAMIDGYCIGGGLLVALQADIRICSDRSTFSIPAARLGLGYGRMGVRPLLHAVGPAVASDLLFSARRLAADEALQVGLVNRCVPADELDAAVRATATGIAANAPLTIRAAKAAIRAELDGLVGEAAEAVDRMAAACFASEDFREGQAAFAAKRNPVFRGC